MAERGCAPLETQSGQIEDGEDKVYRLCVSAKEGCTKVRTRSSDRREGVSSSCISEGPVELVICPDKCIRVRKSNGTPI